MKKLTKLLTIAMATVMAMGFAPVAMAEEAPKELPTTDGYWVDGYWDGATETWYDGYWVETGSTWDPSWDTGWYGGWYDRLTIGGYSAAVGGLDQYSVDAPGVCGGETWYSGHFLIGDHAYQGFSLIRRVPIGQTAYLGGRTLHLVSRYTGYNTGWDIVLANGQSAFSVYDGDVIMYTCNDGAGYNVTVTYWA